MSKTPYEIRLDLLHLAQSILTEQNLNKRIQIENDWNLQCEAARINNERGYETKFPRFPDVPQFGVEDVINTAELLNAFVSKNS